MNRRFFAAVAFASGLAAIGAASYGRNTNPSSADTTFTTVGLIGGGSGTVIAPNWVLTARHVSGNINLNGTTYVHDARYEHPTSDLALLHYNTPFSEWTPLITSSALGMETTIVGFGHSANPRANNTGYNWVDSFGTRRTVTNTIGLSLQLTVSYGFGDLTFQNYLADLDSHSTATPAPYNRDWFGDGGATANEGNVGGGDSGGAWMVNQGGQWRIAGVTTIAISADPLPPGATENSNTVYFAFGVSGSGAADLWDPVNRNWINNTMVPEPGTIAVVGIGFAALLRRRRK